MGPDPLLAGGAIAALSAAGLVAAAVASHQSEQDRSITPFVSPRPGWIARRRARHGVPVKAGHVGVGWRSMATPIHLDVNALAHHGYVGGAPGSGKTTLLRTMIHDFPGPVIVLDGKGSMDLADSIWDQGGLVWEIGAPLRLDVLDDEPSILAQQLLEGEVFTDRAAVYRAIAEHAVLRAATVLMWRAEPREPSRILELLASPETLRNAIAGAMPTKDPAAMRWLAELADPTRTITEGFQTFSERLGALLDSPAGLSLGSGPTAVRLSDVVASRGKLLIRLDQRYGSIGRKVGAWTLVAMLRLAAELRRARWAGRLLFVIDEPRVLGHEGRHLVDLFGTARDAGIGLVVADQGIAGLSVVHPDLPNAILRLTSWQMVFRQGAPADADQMSRIFGTYMRKEVAKSIGGTGARATVREVEAPRVPAAWLQSLPTAHAWVHAAPVGLTSKEVVDRLVVAMPPAPTKRARLALPAPVNPVSTETGNETVVPAGGEVDRATGHVDAKQASEERARAMVYRLVGQPDAEGCRGWRGNHDRDGRPHAWWFGSQPLAYRLLVKWHGTEWLPSSWDVHHTCGHRWCVELSHLKPMPRAEHHRLHAELDRAVVERPDEHVGEGRKVRQLALDEQGEPSRAEQARALKAQNLTLRAIAERLGVSYETVRKDLRDSVVQVDKVDKGVTR